MNRHSLVLMAALFALVLGHAAHAAIPARAANLFTLVELKVKQPVSSFRVQIMRIAPDVSIDPPPGPDSFESNATFIVTINPAHAQSALLAATQAGRRSNWEQLQYPGYARWRVRVVGPWNETIGDLCIDDENQAVLVGDKWFKVDEACVRSLTTDLVKAVLGVETAKAAAH